MKYVYCYKNHRRLCIILETHVAKNIFFTQLFNKPLNISNSNKISVYLFSSLLNKVLSNTCILHSFKQSHVNNTIQINLKQARRIPILIENIIE